jgi:hypothetical protein
MMTVSPGLSTARSADPCGLRDGELDDTRSTSSPGSSRDPLLPVVAPKTLALFASLGTLILLHVSDALADTVKFGFRDGRDYRRHKLADGGRLGCAGDVC